MTFLGLPDVDTHVFMKRHSFVLTTSALDYATGGQSRQSLVQGLFLTQNVLHSVASNTAAQQAARTPFDAFYLPGVTTQDGRNQEHVSADDPAIGAFFLQQLTLPIPDRTPPPLTASIAGPSTVAPTGSGTWSIPAGQPFGGVPPYNWRWSYRLNCPAPPPCTGWICTEGSSAPDAPDLPPDPRSCGVWYDGGASRWFSQAGTYSFPSMVVRLIVTDAAPTSVQYMRTVTFGGSARPASGDSTGTISKAAEITGETTASSVAVTSSSRGASGTPDAYALRAVAPNPSSGLASVRFDLPEAADVSLVVVDVLGREVARLVAGRIEAGTHTARFEGRSLPPGVYVVRFRAGSFSASRPLTLTR